MENQLPALFEDVPFRIQQYLNGLQYISEVVRSTILDDGLKGSPEFFFVGYKNRDLKYLQLQRRI